MYRSGGRNRKNSYTKDSRNAKKNKNPRNAKENKDSRNAKENKDSYSWNSKENKDSGNTKKNKDSRSYHNPHIYPEKRLSWRAEAGYSHMPLLLKFQ